MTTTTNSRAANILMQSRPKIGRRYVSDGRTTKENGVVLTFRLTRSLYNQIKALADNEKTSVNEALNRILTAVLP